MNLGYAASAGVIKLMDLDIVGVNTFALIFILIVFASAMAIRRNMLPERCRPLPNSTSVSEITTSD